MGGNITRSLEYFLKTGEFFVVFNLIIFPFSFKIFISLCLNVCVSGHITMYMYALPCV